MESTKLAFHWTKYELRVLSDLNLDGAGKPLTFSSAIRGPHGKEWGLGDEQELIKLLVTLKCLLPVIAPPRPPPILRE
jgi:hypothetical protein